MHKNSCHRLVFSFFAPSTVFATFDSLLVLPDFAEQFLQFIDIFSDFLPFLLTNTLSAWYCWQN